MDALIFDCDGTLADTMPTYISWLETLAPYGIAFREDRFWTFGGWTSEAIVTLLAREHGVVLDPARVAVEKDLSYARHLPHVRPIPEVVDVALAHRGRLPMAVATGGTRVLCEQILQRIGVADWFDAVVCAEDVPTCKPDPEIFLEAARRAGMSWVDIRTLRP